LLRLQVQGGRVEDGKGGREREFRREKERCELSVSRLLDPGDGDSWGNL